MIASRLADTALIITALGTFVASVTGAIITVLSHKQIGDVKTEVKTMNGLTLAQMADANETRRIEHIRPSKRTHSDEQHMDADLDYDEPEQAQQDKPEG